MRRRHVLKQLAAVGGLGLINRRGSANSIKADKLENAPDKAKNVERVTLEIQLR